LSFLFLLKIETAYHSASQTKGVKQPCAVFPEANNHKLLMSLNGLESKN
jgi:hypothetical protein